MLVLGTRSNIRSLSPFHPLIPPLPFEPRIPEERGPALSVLPLGGPWEIPVTALTSLGRDDDDDDDDSSGAITLRTMPRVSSCRSEEARLKLIARSFQP